MAGKENRVVVTLACSDCRSRNYVTQKNRQKTKDRLQLKKYCSDCRKHTLHREAK